MKLIVTYIFRKVKLPNAFFYTKKGLSLFADCTTTFTDVLIPENGYLSFGDMNKIVHAHQLSQRG